MGNEMSYRVKWVEDAERSLDEILNYIGLPEKIKSPVI